MFQSLKEKLGALKEKLTSLGTREAADEPEEVPEAEPPAPRKKVFKKAKAAAKAAAVAGDQPSPEEATGKEQERPPGKLSGRAPERAPERLPERDVGRAPERAAGRPPERAPESVPERAPGKPPGKAAGKDAEPFTEGFLGWRLKEGKLDDILGELELAFLESDVALPVVDALKIRVKKALLDRRVKLGTDVDEVVELALRDAITGVLSDEVPPPRHRKAPSRFNPPFFNQFIDRHEKPVVVMFVGINGTGKTTTIAKICHLLQKQGYSCVIGAGDTFRAGAIEQLEKHADRLGVKLIKHQAGSDPASVAFDTIEHARARRKDVVLIDTAGRMQTDTGLMEEMSKMERVAKPDLVIYIGDALAGNDAVNEAVAFNKAVGIDAVVLTKVDADVKGGAALSIRFATGAPVIFVGTGQAYDDLQAFTPSWMVDRIFGT